MKKLLLILVLLCCAALPAQARLLDIQPLKTPKGITVWLVEDKSLPVLALSFAFHSGASSDPADKQGVSQLLSNTLDEGAGDMTSEQFQEALRDNAIDLGFDSARDSFGGALRTLTRHQDKALDLLKLALMQPRFDADPIERMKNANITRIRSSLSDPDWIGARLTNDRIYAGHPYALNAGGTLASIAGMTADDLRAARARHFARDKLFVGIAGNVTAADATRIVDQIFGDLPATSPKAEIADAKMPAAGKPVLFAREQPQTNLTMVWPGISLHDADHYAAVVMDYIYGGGGFSSLLMSEVREAKGLTYGISSGRTNLDHADRFTVGGSMQPQNVKPTIETVKQIAAKLMQEDVPTQALQDAKDYLTGSLPLSFGSTMATAGALTSLQINRRPVTALDDYVAKIRAVTPADIRRVATRIFKAEPVIILVGAKPADVDAEIVTTLPNVEGDAPAAGTAAAQ